MVSTLGRELTDGVSNRTVQVEGIFLSLGKIERLVKNILFKEFRLRMSLDIAK